MRLAYAWRTTPAALRHCTVEEIDEMFTLLLELEEEQKAAQYPDYTHMIEEVNPDGLG